MKKTIIVNVMLGRGLGGIEQAALDYTEGLKLAGYEVCMIIHPCAAIKSALEAIGVPFTTLANFGAWDALAILRLRKILKKQHIGICIAHGNRALSLLKHATTTQKLIAVAHNYKIKFDRIKTVFCPTQDLIRHVQSKGMAKENIFHIPNMVRVKYPFTERKRSQPPIIGSMGRFVSKKGFDVFINALAILKSRGVLFRAVLAGSGECEKALKSLSKSLGLGDVLSFPGWAEDKDGFFNSIDIFCLPSHHEPFGIVLLEAMVHRLPVIATASEGPSEIIANHINGILVEKNNPEKLADAIQQLMHEPVKSRQLAKNAFETIYENYDVPVISKRLELAISALVKSG